MLCMDQEVLKSHLLLLEVPYKGLPYKGVLLKVSLIKVSLVKVSLIKVSLVKVTLMPYNGMGNDPFVDFPVDWALLALG